MIYVLLVDLSAHRYAEETFLKLRVSVVVFVDDLFLRLRELICDFV